MSSLSLDRPEGRFNLDDLKAFFAHKRVLVTGAAGSVGKAVAMKLAGLGCAH